MTDTEYADNLVRLVDELAHKGALGGYCTANDWGWDVTPGPFSPTSEVAYLRVTAEDDVLVLRAMQGWSMRWELRFSPDMDERVLMSTALAAATAQRMVWHEEELA